MGPTLTFCPFPGCQSCPKYERQNWWILWCGHLLLPRGNARLLENHLQTSGGADDRSAQDPESSKTNRRGRRECAYQLWRHFYSRGQKHHLDLSRLRSGWQWVFLIISEASCFLNSLLHWSKRAFSDLESRAETDWGKSPQAPSAEHILANLLLLSL